MHGLSQLTAMRLSGFKPNHVVIYRGDVPIRGDWRTAFDLGVYCSLPDTDVISSLDLRPFLGLDVIVSFNDFDTRMAELFDRLIGFANYVICLPQNEPEKGFKWCKKRGAVWMTEYWAEAAA